MSIGEDQRVYYTQSGLPRPLPSVEKWIYLAPRITILPNLDNTTMNIVMRSRRYGTNPRETDGFVEVDVNRIHIVGRIAFDNLEELRPMIEDLTQIIRDMLHDGYTHALSIYLNQLERIEGDVYPIPSVGDMFGGVGEIRAITPNDIEFYEGIFNEPTEETDTRGEVGSTPNS